MQKKGYTPYNRLSGNWCHFRFKDSLPVKPVWKDKIINQLNTPNPRYQKTHHLQAHPSSNSETEHSSPLDHPPKIQLPKSHLTPYTKNPRLKDTQTLHLKTQLLKTYLCNLTNTQKSNSVKHAWHHTQKPNSLKVKTHLNPTPKNPTAKNTLNSHPKNKLSKTHRLKNINVCFSDSSSSPCCPFARPPGGSKSSV